MTPRAARSLERWAVVLVALHSVGVGVFLLGFPDTALRFGGWKAGPSTFFVRQGGVFHFVLAIGYLAEHARHRGVGLLVTAKTLAAVFLTGMAVAGGETAWAVPFSAVTDGAMALVVGWLHRRARAA